MASNYEYPSRGLGGFFVAFALEPAIVKPYSRAPVPAPPIAARRLQYPCALPGLAPGSGGERGLLFYLPGFYFNF